MKQIIILLLVIILGVICYGQYKKYKRFSLTEYEYKTPDGIDVNNVSNRLLLDYYETVESLNGYVITQWSSDGIDVRNPGDDDDEIVAAVSEYRKKLANVKFYETRLLNFAEEEPSIELSEDERKNMLTKKMFYNNSSENTLRIGERSALVYEIQRLLDQNGYSIQHDGHFSTETFNSLRSFEEKNGLLADGKLDAITLAYLLN